MEVEYIIISQILLEMRANLSLLLGSAVVTNAALYNLAATIPWRQTAPSSVDQSTIVDGTYYLNDRTNAGVHVIDLSRNIEKVLVRGDFAVTTVNGSIVSSKSGPDGLVVLKDLREIYIGDGNGLIRILDLASDQIVANVSTGSIARADEFAYNPTTGIAVATNPNENPPYVSVVNTTSRVVLGKIDFDTASGLEQPAYNPVDGSFWVSVPSTNANPGGEVALLNTDNLTITKSYPVPSCINAGIVFGPPNVLFIACSADQQDTFNLTRSYLMDITTGTITHIVSNVNGVDQVAYSSTTGYFYAAAYQQLKNDLPFPNLAIIASDGTVLQQIPTDNVTAHSVAVDNTNGNVYVPVKSKGIMGYSLSSSNSSSVSGPTSTPSVVPFTGGTSKIVEISGWHVICYVAAMLFCIEWSLSSQE